MLPERLSTDLTSLNPDVDRLAVVVEIAIGAEGVCGESKVYRALVHNHAKLAYHALGAWLEGDGPLPTAAAAVPGLAENLKLQDGVAQRLKAHRHDHGALELETVELRAEIDSLTAQLARSDGAHEVAPGMSRVRALTDEIFTCLSRAASGVTRTTWAWRICAGRS
jgi:exoribonuclease R